MDNLFAHLSEYEDTFSTFDRGVNVFSMFTIAIIDDHKVLLDGIVSMLQSQETIRHIDPYYRASDFLQGLKKGRNYDLLITDIQMPDISGIDLITTLRKERSDMRILVMSMLNTKDLLFNLLNMGISGYFLKGNDSEELIKAIQQVLRNEPYFSSELQPLVKQYYTGDNETLLSSRELEIASWISKGKTNNEIGEELSISPYTIQTHRKNIFRKLNVHNTAGLLKVLSEKQLI